MARPIAALWRAHANPRESRRGNQILSQTAIRPFCHMKKQHVNKTQKPNGQWRRVAYHKGWKREKDTPHFYWISIVELMPSGSPSRISSRRPRRDAIWAVNGFQFLLVRLVGNDPVGMNRFWDSLKTNYKGFFIAAIPSFPAEHQQELGTRTCTLVDQELPKGSAFQDIDSVSPCMSVFDGPECKAISLLLRASLEDAALKAYPMDPRQAHVIGDNVSSFWFLWPWVA